MWLSHDYRDRVGEVLAYQQRKACIASLELKLELVNTQATCYWHKNLTNLLQGFHVCFSPVPGGILIISPLNSLELCALSYYLNFLERIQYISGLFSTRE